LADPASRAIVEVMRLALTLAVVCAVPPPSPAAAQSASDDAEARGLYQAGAQAFGAGSYERALEHWRRAYELSHRSDLLYDIGQSADRLRRDREALEAFEQYLASDGVDASLRPQVEARVEVLRRAVAEADARDAATTTTTITPAATGGGDPGPGIASIVIGGVVAAGGGVMLAIAAVENGAVQGAPMPATWSDYAGRLDAANALVIAGSIAAGVGAVLVVVGAVLVGSSGSPSAEVALGPGSISVRGSF
jgi:tetratricopeptide (TPR) repeat protein